MILVKKLREDAKVPQKAYDSDAGFDLFACEDVDFNEYLDKNGESEICRLLRPLERHLFKTGIAIQYQKDPSLKHNFFAEVRDKSGLSVKNGLHVLAGIIDEGYTGEIQVCLINLGEEPVKIKAGQKIAQLIIHKIPIFTNSDVELVEDFEETGRGSDGFGSTGI